MFSKKPRLIATDMDGTAIKNDHLTMPERNIKALARAAAEGIYVVPVTGRSLDVLPGGILPFYSHVITANGASVYDVRAGKTILTRHLSAEEARIAWSILAQTPDMIELFVSNKMGIDRAHFERIEEIPVPPHHHEYYAHGSPLIVDSYEEFIQTDATGIEKFYIPLNTSPETERVREELKATGLFEVSTSGDRNLELNKRGVNKGLALCDLCRTLGVDMSDVVAFGDEANDLTMLQSAGYGVAVANAAPALLASAEYKTLSNEDAGLADFLEKNFGI